MTKASIGIGGNLKEPGLTSYRSQFKDIILRNSGSGLISGGELSINAGDNTKFDISAGEAQFVDSSTDPNNPTIKRVMWDNQTAITPTETASNFVAIKDDGTFVQQSTFYTHTQRKTHVQLGALSIISGVIIDATTDPTNLAYNYGDSLYELLLDGIGVINISGNLFSANGTNLKIDKSIGESMLASINYETDKNDTNFFTEPSQTAITFFPFYRDAGGNLVLGASTTNIDPNQYDDGSGTLQSVPNNNYTIQRIVMSVGGGIIAIAYGQNLYTSQVAAVNAINLEPFVRVPQFGRSVLLRSYLIVRQGATDLSDPNQAVFVDENRFGDLGYNGSSSVIAAKAIPSVKSYSFTSQGIGAGTHYVAGYYFASSTDANLTQASTTVTFGSTNIAYGAHAFIVSGGNGTTDGSDLVLTVSGTSITDAGVRTAADSEVIEPTAAVSALNTYFETTKKWIGQITYTLTSTGGTTFSYDFNYGLTKYDDFGNRNFIIKDFELEGLCGQTDSGFNIQLIHHAGTGWTYAATGFTPGNGTIADMNTDYNTEINLTNNEHFAYKRDNLSTFVEGVAREGFIIRITTGANNSLQSANFHVGVEF